MILTTDIVQIVKYCIYAWKHFLVFSNYHAMNDKFIITVKLLLCIHFFENIA